MDLMIQILYMLVFFLKIWSNMHMFNFWKTNRPYIFKRKEYRTWLTYVNDVQDISHGVRDTPCAVVIHNEHVS